MKTQNHFVEKVNVYSHILKSAALRQLWGQRYTEIPFSVALCCLVLQTQSLFQTKIRHFPSPLSEVYISKVINCILQGGIMTQRLLLFLSVSMTIIRYRSSLKRERKAKKNITSCAPHVIPQISSRAPGMET